MKVLRIVADIAAADPSAAKRFYQDILGLDVTMDHQRGLNILPRP